MVVKTCFTGLAKAKCVIYKLIMPLMIVDLILTGFILHELLTVDSKACCTDNLNYKSQCSYEKIGNADKISRTNGYCVAPNGFDCSGDLEQCASDNGVDLTKLCSPKVLKDVATYNFGVFTIFLIIKGIGLIFLLTLEFKSCCKKKKEATTNDKAYRKVHSDSDVDELNDSCGTKCKKKCCNCCKKMTILLLRIFFIIFGSCVSMVIFYLMRKYKDVTFGSCESLNDGIISQCKTMSKNCIGHDEHTIYNVYFKNLDLDGPFWIQTSSSLLGGILWLTRLAVLREKWNNSIVNKVTNSLTSVNLDSITKAHIGSKMGEVVV